MCIAHIMSGRQPSTMNGSRDTVVVSASLKKGRGHFTNFAVMNANVSPTKYCS